MRHVPAERIWIKQETDVGSVAAGSSELEQFVWKKGSL